MDRERVIVRVSIVGIIANIFLAGFKAVVGVLSSSVAVILDAVNNLSDALSSIITIIGAKLANKQPDKKHPLGHGRVEYLSTMAISIIILYAGFTSLIESVKKIIHPITPDYSVTSLIIISVAVVVKIFLGTYVKRNGQRVNSDSLVASGTDALFDSIISAATLLAAIIFTVSGLSLESYLGVIISVIIIKSGFEMLRDTISEILGERVDPEIAHKIKQIIISFPEVRGAYDLILHNYGPDRLIGSVHIEIPEDMTAREMDKLERNITLRVGEETGVFMTGVSVYSINTTDKKAAEIEKTVRSVALRHDEVIQIHGFYYEEDQKMFLFDIIIDYDYKNRQEIYEEVVRELQEIYPDYRICATLDVDISD